MPQTQTSWFDLPNGLLLTNGTVEIGVTTSIGPRIAAYRLKGGENILGRAVGTLDKPNEWHPWGGHRVWIAPEDPVKSYGLDNSPVAHELIGTRGVRLTQPVEPKTHVQKQLVVTLDEHGTGVSVENRLTNRGTVPMQLATWGLTIMNGGGTAILPQEPFKRHEDEFLPARPLVLWHYTDLADPRWQHGPRFLRLQGDATKSTPQKVGIGNRLGWVAYAREGLLFVKRAPFDPKATYTDMGCNFEVYTEAAFFEVESLGPLVTVKPGETASHTERWHLFDKLSIPKDDASLEKTLAPLIAQTA